MRSTKGRAVVCAIAGLIAIAIGVIVAVSGSSETRDLSHATESSAATTATTESTPQGCSTSAQCAEEGANGAAGEASGTATQSRPKPTSTGATTPAPSETGTSVATALSITPGVQETGNSGTTAYGEGGCGPEQGQFWKAKLNQGELVTIVWGGPDSSATGLDIWPPGATNIHGSGEGRVTYQSTEGEDTEKHFTAPTTGVYPIVIDDSCGQAGEFHFTLTTRQPR
jgi:hypothetical protein